MRKTPTQSAHSMSGTGPTTILTIGHSTRSIGTFIQMLQAFGVKRLVDVRTIPRSRHNPQFNRDVLPGTLLQAGIGYTHMEGLGGLRHARTDSVNTGWHNTSFRLRRLYANVRIPNRHQDAHSSRKTRAS